MKLQYTPEAIQDLKEIIGYIRHVLHNPTAAKRIGRAILDNCSQLKQYPFSGMFLQEKTGYKTDLRVLVCENYLALYRVEENMISVSRIFDGRQNYLLELFDDE